MLNATDKIFSPHAAPFLLEGGRRLHTATSSVLPRVAAGGWGSVLAPSELFNLGIVDLRESVMVS